MRRQFAALLLLSCAMLCSRFGAAAADLPWDHLPAGRQALVAAVADAERLLLDDGTSVALAGLRGPRAAETASGSAEPGFAEAEAALAVLTLPRTIRLYGPPRAVDRHGHRVAHIALINESGTPEAWVQGMMLSQGMARAYPAATEHPDLAAAMLALEGAARTERLGLWRQTDYAIRGAADPDRIPTGFQLIEGRVLAIGESGNSLFLNFGTDWRQDFTVVVEHSDRTGFAAGLRGLRSLQGQRLRVRGHVFRYGGPAIRVRHDYAMERLEEQR